MNGKGKKKGYIGLAIIAVLLIATIVADVLVAKYLTMIKLYFRETRRSRPPVNLTRSWATRASSC